jgi:hypothetical protein
VCMDDGIMESHMESYSCTCKCSYDGERYGTVTFIDWK